MSRPGFAFSTTMKVRYAEIDAQKVVFNSRYLEYVDVAVTDFWDWTGVAAAVPGWAQTEFHVRRTEIDYLKPFVLGDIVEAYVRIERLGTSSIVERFELCHAETGALHSVITMTIVNVDLATGRSTPLPADLRAYLEAMPAG